jgi:hypothetical protein
MCISLVGVLEQLVGVYDSRRWKMSSSITVVIFCWRICLISESMGHHDSEIMDDGSID